MLQKYLLLIYLYIIFHGIKCDIQSSYLGNILDLVTRKYVNIVDCGSCELLQQL